MALAAGKIYVSWKLPGTQVSVEPSILSGFWVEGIYFITAGHFLIAFGTSVDTDEAAVLNAMLTGDDQTPSWVSTRMHNDVSDGQYM